MLFRSVPRSLKRVNYTFDYPVRFVCATQPEACPLHLYGCPVRFVCVSQPEACPLHLNVYPVRFVCASQPEACLLHLSDYPVRFVCATQPEVCHGRLKQRGRQEETSVPLEYLKVNALFDPLCLID